MKSRYFWLVLLLCQSDARWTSGRPVPVEGHDTQVIKPRRSWFAHARDRLIETIWSPSTSPAAALCQHSSPPHSFRSTPPSRLQAKYEGDLLLRFQLQSRSEAEALESAIKILFLDTWESNTAFVDVRLSRDVVPSLLGLLPPSMQESHTILLHDLAQAVYESYSPAAHDRVTHIFNQPSTPTVRPSSVEGNIFFQQYQPLAVIQPWMRLLRSLFPSHVRLLNIGLSYEGRDIHALRVGLHPSNAEQPLKARKTIIVTGGSHAREWISTSTVSFVAYSFVTGFGRSKDITRLLEKFDFVFIPTINPDGYVYSWENDRLWRKNRQQTSLPFCTGMDLDHSFGYEWNKEPDSGNPCAESYGGDVPFEAIESRRLADWARNETASKNVEIVAFLDFHSYSQQVLYPYSFSCTSTPPSLENLEEVAIGLAKAIRTTTGEVYGVTSACETASPRPCDNEVPNSSLPQIKSGQSRMSRAETRGGSGLDYFYHELHVPYAYQIKLRDTGAYGFLLPEDNIIPTGKEASKAVEYLGIFLAGDKGIEEQGIHDNTKLSHPRDQDGFKASDWTDWKSPIESSRIDGQSLELKKP